MKIRLIPGIVLSLAMALTLGAQTPAPATTAAPKATKAAKAPVAAMPSDADIAANKAKGMVWVNTGTKVYHMSDNTQFYGKTKQGKFMTETDAKAAGFKAAKESATKKVAKSKAPATTTK